MDANRRRQAIMDCLQEAAQPITGSELAARLSVSRQVIVQDIALLRAQGQKILATPQGYIILSQDNSKLLKRTFACRHFEADTRKELNIFVDCGGIVEDVIVEHPIYGQISGSLMLKSRADVAAFCRKVEESDAALLSSLTEGVHLHTVRAEKSEVFRQIEKALDDAGILLKKEN